MQQIPSCVTLTKQIISRLERCQVTLAYIIDEFLRLPIHQQPLSLRPLFSTLMMEDLDLTLGERRRQLLKDSSRACQSVCKMSRKSQLCLSGVHPPRRRALTRAVPSNHHRALRDGILPILQSPRSAHPGKRRNWCKDLSRVFLTRYVLGRGFCNRYCFGNGRAKEGHIPLRMHRQPVLDVEMPPTA